MTWRDEAVDRYLEGPRERAEARLCALLDAARDLTNESMDAGFTVAEVAEKAGISLKTLYRCISGKDELLLALIEEESALGATMLLQSLAYPPRSATDRLRHLVEEFFALARSAPGYASVLVREYRRLKSEHPQELGSALTPLLQLIEDEIRGAAPIALSGTLAYPEAARIVFAILLDGIASVLIEGREIADIREPVWHFIGSGLQLNAVHARNPVGDGHER